MNKFSELTDKINNIGTQIHNYLSDFYKVFIEHGNDGILSYDSYYNLSEKYGKKILEVKSNPGQTIDQARDFLKSIGVFEYDFTECEKNKSSFVDFLTSCLKQKMKNFSLSQVPLRDDRVERCFISYVCFFWEKLQNDFEIFPNVEKKRIIYLNKNDWFNFESLSECLEKTLIGIFKIFEIDFKTFKRNYSSVDVASEIPSVEKIKESIKNEEVESKFLSFFEILSTFNNENKMEIPFYQRNYVWPKALAHNIPQTISEISKIENFGVILTSKRGSTKIIDGQQRLTTMILFYVSISMFIFKELDSMGHSLEDSSKGTLNDSETSFLKTIKNVKYVKNIVNSSNDDYAKDLEKIFKFNLDKIEATNFGSDDWNSKSQIHINYKEICKSVSMIISRLEGIDRIKELIFLFRNSQFLIVDRVIDNVSDPIKLFIDTNDKRTPLSNFDLVKAYLHSKDSNNKCIKKISKIDKDISKDELSSHDDSIISAFLKYSKSINDRETIKSESLFSEYKSYFDQDLTDINSLDEHLDDFIEFIKIYRLAKGIDEDQNIALSDFVQVLSTKGKVNSIYLQYLIHFTKILCDMRKGDITNQSFIKLTNELRKCLFLIEKFHFTWKLIYMSGQSYGVVVSPLEKFIPKLNRIINEGKYSEIYKAFYKIVQDDDSILNKYIFNDQWKISKEKIDYAFEDKNVYESKDTIASVLYRLPFNLFNGGIEIKNLRDVLYKNSQPSIEHIYPQDDSLWVKESSYQPELKMYLERIGNKFILDKTENSLASNEVFKEKQKIYRQNNLVKNDKTLDFYIEDDNKNFNIMDPKLNWGVDEIKKRETYIKEKIISLWDEIIN